MKSFLQLPTASSLFGPDILLSTLFSNTLNLSAFLNVTDKFDIHTEPHEKLQFCIYRFYVFNSRQRDKGSGLNDSKHYPDSVSS
jgi:hypothetical protein